jgi:hypothetical protein
MVFGWIGFWVFVRIWIRSVGFLKDWIETVGFLKGLDLVFLGIGLVGYS